MGARQGVIEDGVFDLTLSMDLDALTNGALKDTLFQASALYTYGNNLSAKYVHDFSITSNIATYNSLRLDELWGAKIALGQKGFDQGGEHRGGQ